MTRSEQERRDGLALSRAAQLWERAAHQIFLLCRSCDHRVIVKGTVGLTPNLEPFVGWTDREQTRARWGQALESTHPRLRHFGAITFTCPDCGHSTYVGGADQLRAALTALGVPQDDYVLHRKTKIVRLVLGKSLPRPDEETVAFLEAIG